MWVYTTSIESRVAMHVSVLLLAQLNVVGSVVGDNIYTFMSVTAF